MLKMKRNIMILCSVVLVASMIIGGTLAYFTDKQKVVNTFTTAGGTGPGDTTDTTGISLKLEEPGYKPAESLNMYPADAIVKDPTITNLKATAYVRAKVELKDTTTGDIITDDDRANKILATLFYAATASQIKTDGSVNYTAADLGSIPRVNSKFELDTTKGSTGTYYYNFKTIMAKNESAVLFNRVVIPADWSQTDLALLGKYDIVITGEAIQSVNMANAATAFTALDGAMAP